MKTPIDDNYIHNWWILPGRILGGEYPSSPDGSREKLDHLLAMGFRCFIDLTHPSDNLTDYSRHLSSIPNGSVSYFHFPIVDNKTVGHNQYEKIVKTIEWAIDCGERIYLHCWGGIGRTSTVAAIYLACKFQHLTPEEIFSLIDKARAGTKKAEFPAPANNQQRVAVTSYMFAKGLPYYAL